MNSHRPVSVLSSSRHLEFNEEMTKSTHGTWGGVHSLMQSGREKGDRITSKESEGRGWSSFKPLQPVKYFVNILSLINFEAAFTRPTSILAFSLCFSLPPRLHWWLFCAIFSNERHVHTDSHRLCLHCASPLHAHCGQSRLVH